MDIEWRDILGYEGVYQVSNNGKVRRISSMKLKSGRIKNVYKLLKGHNINGYKSVSLSKDGISKGYLVHRLVATAFIPNRHNRPIVNHIDEVRSNNHVDNLEWVTYKENTNWGTGIERNSKARINGKRSKAVVATNIEDGSIIEFPSMSEAKRNGFDQSTISKCCRRVAGYEQHKGYCWRYK